MIYWLKTRQNYRHFPDHVFMKFYCIYIVLSRLSVKFVPRDPISNTQTQTPIMTWRQSGNTPLSELKLDQLTEIYVSPCRDKLKNIALFFLIACWICIYFDCLRYLNTVSSLITLCWPLSTATVILFKSIANLLSLTDSIIYLNMTFK